MSKFVIYKIYKQGIDETYVGSTCNFKKRFTGHKTKCYNTTSKEYNYPLYVFIRENGGFDECNIEIIFRCPENVINKTQAKIIEEWFRENLDAKINRKKCYSSKEEKFQDRRRYLEETKEHTRILKQIWYENNIEKEKKRMLDRYYNNKKEKCK